MQGQGLCYESEFPVWHDIFINDSHRAAYFEVHLYLHRPELVFRACTGEMHRIHVHSMGGGGEADRAMKARAFCRNRTVLIGGNTKYKSVEFSKLHWRSLMRLSI